MRLTALLLSIATAIFASGVARAQTGSARTEEARGAFERGVAAYESGSFEEALASFQHAYALTENAELLFNIGTVADRLRRDELARESYEGYLRAYPAAVDRANIEARIAAIRAAHPDTPPVALPEAVAPEPEPAAPIEAVLAAPPEPPPASGTDPGPWILVASGGAAALAGAALLIVTAVDLDAASRADTWAALSGPHQRVPIFSAVGWSLVGVGALALGVGIGWAIVGSDNDERSATARIRLGPGGLSLDGTF